MIGRVEEIIKEDGLIALLFYAFVFYSDDSRFFVAVVFMLPNTPLARMSEKFVCVCDSFWK